MIKLLCFLLIIFIPIACAKQRVDLAEEFAGVREIVSKMSSDRISKAQEAKTAEVAQSIDEASLGTSDFVYPYKGRRDPFYSFAAERKKMNAELEEKEKKKKEVEKKAELKTNIVQEEWGKVEISAILGDARGYLVLFGGDDTIYQKDDYIGKDRKIKIASVGKDSVDLAMIKDGKVLNKQIVMKEEK